MQPLDPPAHPPLPPPEPAKAPSAGLLMRLLAAGAHVEAATMAESLARESPLCSPGLEVALLLAAASPDPQLAARGVWGLGRLVQPAPETVDRLTQCLAHPSPLVRAEAAEALGHLEQRAATCIDRILATLQQDTDLQVRMRAAFALGRIPVPARFAECLATLQALEADSETPEPLRREAAESLGRLVDMQQDQDTPKGSTPGIEAVA